MFLTVQASRIATFGKDEIELPGVYGRDHACPSQPASGSPACSSGQDPVQGEMLQTTHSFRFPECPGAV